MLKHVFNESKQISEDSRRSFFCCFVGPSFTDGVFSVSQLHKDFEHMKSLMEEVLSAPPPNDIVVNNEFAGMIR